MTTQKPKIVAIVGPTASGKTALSILLAKTFGGEIISADSRQVYRGLDIGTGKVTEAEMNGVPHHMLDVVDPRQVYTASEYVRDASSVLHDILKRERVPIIVGGSFFYVDALLGRISLPQVPPNESLRSELDTMTTEVLYEHLSALDSRRAAEIDKDNRRRLIRAIEIGSALGAVPLPHTESPYDVLILGIDISKTDLHENINERLIARVEAGMIEEVKQLHEAGLSYTRMYELGLEYRYVSEYLQEKLPYCAMLETLETKIRQFAKRQMTWLKRDSEIVWIEPNKNDVIETVISEFLKSK